MSVCVCCCVSLYKFRSLFSQRTGREKESGLMNKNPTGRVFVPYDKHTDEILTRSSEVMEHSIRLYFDPLRGAGPQEDRPEVNVMKVNAGLSHQGGKSGVFYEVMFEKQKQLCSILNPVSGGPSVCMYASGHGGDHSWWVERYDALPGHGHTEEDCPYCEQMDGLAVPD